MEFLPLSHQVENLLDKATQQVRDTLQPANNSGNVEIIRATTSIIDDVRDIAEAGKKCLTTAARQS